MENLVFRPAMLPVLLYQRTQYAWSFHQRVRRIFGPLRLYGLYWRHIAPLIERLRRNSIAKMYRDELAKEFGELKGELLNTSRNILDIGCGLAGIDLFLYRHCGNNANLHLLDKEGISEVYYGFKEEAAYYNKSNLTKKFLMDNGVEEKHIAFYDAQKNEFPDKLKFDLIISLISWGFHYPVSIYIDKVANALQAGGKLIIDIRKGTDGLQELNRRFPDTRVVAEDRKRVRVVATKH